MRHTKETFGGYWERWLARRWPYLEPGTWTGYEINGRRRLVPAFGSCPLGEVSVEIIRDFAADLAEAVEAGELAPKTVNHAQGALVVCLNDAVETAARGQPRAANGCTPAAADASGYLTRRRHRRNHE